MELLEKFEAWLLKESGNISKVVDFNPLHDRLLPMDFTSANTELTDTILDDNAVFSAWVTQKIADNNCRYGIGGYNEHRTIYRRSAHFDTSEEPRRLHLGVDIWGAAGTPVYNFFDAEVHSFKYNSLYGDYGATIILKYNLNGLIIYALYGHLSLASLEGLAVGQHLAAGKRFAAFGVPDENGHWPPHLHFQLLFSMQGLKGDYPGVCQFSKKKLYLSNCPDPGHILSHTFKLNCVN